jgi:hypothetical protein
MKEKIFLYVNNTKTAAIPLSKKVKRSLISAGYDVIDDVNNKMNTCFPTVSEWSEFVEAYNAKLTDEAPKIVTTVTRTTTTIVETFPVEEPEVPEEGTDDEVVEDVPETIEETETEPEPEEPEINEPEVDDEEDEDTDEVETTEPDDFTNTTTIITDTGKTTTIVEKTTEVRYISTKVKDSHSEETKTVLSEDGLTTTTTFTVIDVKCVLDESGFLDIDNYQAIPDKYLRALMKGVAYKYYIRDEEGERVASEYYVDYQNALFMILRDYDEHVPPIFRSHQKGFITGMGGDLLVPVHGLSRGCF